MFDPAVKTPQNTNWTMGLLSRLEKAAGPGVMEKPMFPITEDMSVPPVKQDDGDDGVVLKAVEDGTFDKPFPSGSVKLSELYKQTQSARIAHPEVTIKEIKPRTPENLVTPKYPPISLMVHAQGSVTASFTILDDGTPSVLPRLTGNRLLQGVVVDAIRNWRFPKEAAGEEIEATFEFALNCPKESAQN
jgi:outer membrane biosynthesis protein TonB